MNRLWFLLALLVAVSALPAQAISPAQRRAIFASGFSPASLALTVWLDPSDLSTEFTDSACTVPAVVGNTIGCIKNKGTAGGAFIQATSGKRPTLTLSSGHYYLAFVAANSTSLASSSTINLSAASSLGLCVASTPTSSTTSEIVFESGTNVNSVAGSFAFIQNVSAGVLGAGVNSFGAADFVGTTATTYGNGVTSVLSIPGLNITLATPTAKMPLRVNGAFVPISSLFAGAGVGTVYGNLPIYIGGRAGTSAFADTRLYGFALRSTPFSLYDLQRLERWMGKKAGLSL